MNRAEHRSIASKSSADRVVDKVSQGGPSTPLRGWPEKVGKAISLPSCGLVGSLRKKNACWRSSVRDHTDGEGMGVLSFSIQFSRRGERAAIQDRNPRGEKSSTKTVQSEGGRGNEGRKDLKVVSRQRTPAMQFGEEKTGGASGKRKGREVEEKANTRTIWNCPRKLAVSPGICTKQTAVQGSGKLRKHLGREGCGGSRSHAQTQGLGQTEGRDCGEKRKYSRSISAKIKGKRRE